MVGGPGNGWTSTNFNGWTSTNFINFKRTAELRQGASRARTLTLIAQPRNDRSSGLAPNGTKADVYEPQRLDIHQRQTNN
jgi:hypothetical protein